LFGEVTEIQGEPDAIGQWRDICAENGVGAADEEHAVEPQLVYSGAMMQTN